MEGIRTKPCLKPELHERGLAFAGHLHITDSALGAPP